MKHTLILLMNPNTINGFVRILVLTGLALIMSSVRADEPPANPYEPTQDEYQTTLLIVGGSNSGTAAAVTAGRLKIPTIWVLRAPRDMDGLSTNAINPDRDLPMRCLVGLALEYDVNARHTTGFNVGGRQVA